MKYWLSTIKLCVMMILMLLLSGCAVMSKSDCLNANWYDVGFEVAMDGSRDVQGEFSKRANICAKHGTSVSYEDFEDGHVSGIEEYCGISNAVLLGTKGSTKAINNNVCPEIDYPGFESSYHAGYKLHVLQDRANEARYEIDRLVDQKYRYQRRRQELRHQANSRELSDQERKRAAYYSRDLRRDIQDIRSRIHHYERQMVEHQRAADAYAELLELEYIDLFE
jgi:hypothetical protein